MQRDAEQLAILEGVQRIADLASGKVKGLSEREWKEEVRRRLAEIEPGTAKALAGKQISALIKKNIKAAIAEAVAMNDKFMPAAAFIRNELILRGVTFLKGLVRQSNEKQLRKLRDQKTEAEFFAALAMLAIERNPIDHALAVAEAEEADWPIVLCKTPTGWSAELEAMLGVQALGKTRKRAVDELKKRATLKIQSAKVERAWWDEP
jgi:hypothetical protein